MERTEIESLLLQMGIPAGLKGLKYITDAIILFDDGWDGVPITRVYWKIAKDNQTGDACVERAIRHALEKARSSSNNELVKRYIGTQYKKNTASLKLLYTVLKQEQEARVKNLIAEDADVIKILGVILNRYNELEQSLNEFGVELKKYQNSFT